MMLGAEFGAMQAKQELRQLKFGARTYIPVEDAEQWRDNLLQAQADEAAT